jgi:hypothetical protein
MQSIQPDWPKKLSPPEGWLHVRPPRDVFAGNNVRYGWLYVWYVHQEVSIEDELRERRRYLSLLERETRSLSLKMWHFSCGLTGPLSYHRPILANTSEIKTARTSNQIETNYKDR